MTTDNTANAAALNVAANGRATDVCWTEIATATWTPVGDEAYTSETFPGAVLTVSYTTVKAFAAAADPSLENGDVLTASIDFADGSYVVWERPWYDAVACAPQYDKGTSTL